MKKFKTIEITLENCEHYTVPSSCIDRMVVDGFKNTYYIQGNYGECSKSLKAYSFSLTIKNINDVKPYYDWSKPFIERVHTGGDITAITIKYEDNTDFSFYVPWDYDDRQDNSWQIVKKNDNLMSIIIKKPRNKSK